MANPTEKEEQLITQLRERLNDVIDSKLESDLYLIRWIRARDGNVDAAEKMLRNSLKWREENGIDGILNEEPDPYLTHKFPYILDGVDKKGQPVLCIAVGEWNPKKLVEDGKVKEFSNYVNRMFERIVAAIEACRTGSTSPISQFTLLMSFENFSMFHIASFQAIQSMLQFATVYEGHYPEILYKAFFINTNPVFQLFFAMMRPLLAPKTLGKITCFGSNRSSWEPAIRQVVDESQIPVEFGG